MAENGLEGLNYNPDFQKKETIADRTLKILKEEKEGLDKKIKDLASMKLGADQPKDLKAALAEKKRFEKESRRLNRRIFKLTADAKPRNNELVLWLLLLVSGPLLVVLLVWLFTQPNSGSVGDTTISATEQLLRDIDSLNRLGYKIVDAQSLPAGGDYRYSLGGQTQFRLLGDQPFIYGLLGDSSRSRLVGRNQFLSLGDRRSIYEVKARAVTPTKLVLMCKLHDGPDPFEMAAQVLDDLLLFVQKALNISVVLAVCLLVIAVVSIDIWLIVKLIGARR